MKTSLLVDIGNSTTVFARYVSGDIEPIVTSVTLDLKVSFPSELSAAYDQVIVASVVPELNAVIVQRFSNAFFLSSETIPLLRVEIDAPEHVGADRLVTALAAYHRFHAECLIVDSGTAITFERVSSEGVYLGGAIVPGMRISSQALHDYTAQIPLIWVKPQEALIGGTTQEAVQAGLFHGYRELINGLIRRFKTETPGLQVIGAGSGLAVFSDQLDLDLMDDQLQLKGLAIVADYLRS